MNNNINLLEKEGVIPSEMTKKFSLRGQTSPRPVYRIPLDFVYYNNKNGRIATLISKWESENGYKISELDRDLYNKTIGKYIIDSNEVAFKKTLKNIEALQQINPGVVLSNGCIIDGNRRYTCLRTLNEKDSTGKFGYFEAVILDPDISADEKEIKRLELELQHGQDEKVSYNPVESLIDVYKTIEEEQLLTLKEYSDNCKKSESQVKKELDQAKIIIDFLDYINAQGKYYIAVDLQVDASIVEIYNIKQKLSEEQWEQAKIVLYDNMLVKTVGDIKQRMRDIKLILNSDYFEDYFQEHLDSSKKIHEKLKETDDMDSDFIKDNIRANDELKEDLNLVFEKYRSQAAIAAAKKIPVDQLEDIYLLLTKVDIDSIEHLHGEERKQFIENYKMIESLLNKIGSIIDGVK